MSVHHLLLRVLSVAVGAMFSLCSHNILAQNALFHPPVEYRFVLADYPELEENYERINMHSISISDINGDNHLDILHNSLAGEGDIELIRVMLGTGTGSFQNVRSAHAEIVVRTDFEIWYKATGRIYITDIDQNGYMDFLTVSQDIEDPDNIFLLLLNDGSGGFQPPSRITYETPFRQLRFGSASIADLNADGYPDIAAQVINRPDELHIYTGNGGAQFQLTTIFDVPPNFANKISFFDFNNDEQLDVVLEDYRNDSITVLSGDGRDNLQTLSIRIPAGMGGSNSSRELQFCDLNDDGIIDLIAPGNDDINISLGTDYATFLPVVSVPEAGFSIQGIAIADFNGDGDKDIATADILGDEIRVFLGNGDASFQPPVVIAIEFDLINYWSGNVLASDDIDADGNMDLVALSGEHVIVLLNSAAPFVDSDNDAVPDFREGPCSLALDIDSDDDGLPDGREDSNANGIVDEGETSPCEADTDGDGIQDGTEMGVEVGVKGLAGSGQIEGTDLLVFIADTDPSTTTDPLSWDSDDDKLADGQEDLNRNGRLDPGETDPLNTTNLVVPIQGEFLDSGNGSGGGALNLFVLAGLIGLCLTKSARK